MKLIEQSVRVLDPLTMDDGIKKLRLCEYAGRTCYDSRDRITENSYEKFLRNVIKRGHTSVLEHDKVTMEMITSRDVLAQITRHRAGIVFSVQSQRYVQADKDGGIAFIRPDFYVDKDGDKIDAKTYCASRMWEKSAQETEEAYSYLLHDCSKPPEDARKVLDNSVATDIVVTVNFRELLHVYNLRSSVRAYPEMRTLMGKMIDALTPVMPPIWDWAKEEGALETC